MITETDPRFGKPSASSFVLPALCPGQPTLVASMENVPEPQDEDQERGTRLHAAWEKGDPAGLDTADTEIFDRGERISRNVVAEWEILRGAAVTEKKREERFYWHDEKGNLAASGQADRHWIFDEWGLVADFKSLWCRSLTPAERNWQARLLAVLIAREYGLTHVRFAFLKAMFGTADIVDYNQGDLRRAEWSVEQVLWEARQDGAQRRPGAHCRHCKAATACPEAAAWVSLPTSALKVRPGAGITPKQAQILANQVSLNDCRWVWQGITTRRNIEDAIKARLKALPEPKLADLGLKLGTASINRPITNPAGAFSYLQRLGFAEAQIWRAVSIKNGVLTDIVMEKMNLSKKAAEQWIRQKLEHCITESVQDRALEEI